MATDLTVAGNVVIDGQIVSLLTAKMPGGPWEDGLDAVSGQHGPQWHVGEHGTNWIISSAPSRSGSQGMLWSTATFS